MVYVLGEEKKLAVKALTTFFLELTERESPRAVYNSPTSSWKIRLFCDLITLFMEIKLNF